MPVASEGQHRAKRRRLNLHAPKLKPSTHTATSIRVLHFASKLKPTPKDTGKGKRRRSKPVPEEQEHGKTSDATSSAAHSCSSSDDSSPESPSSGRDLAVVSAARKSASLVWGARKSSNFDEERPASGSQPAPKNDAEAWPLEDLFQAEAGLPTISKGRCTLCGENTLRCPWGNPGCRGCSIIDGLTLDMHPLSNLIRQRPGGSKVGKPKAVGRMPLVWRRDGLTPPPVKIASRESLRSRAASARPSPRSARAPAGRSTAKSWKEKTGAVH